MKSVWICVGAALLSAAAWAAPEDKSDTPAKKVHSVCINPSDINHMGFPDDKTILFYMNGGKVRIWRNDLPRACQGLSFEKGIAYEIRGGMICSNMQVVYVMNRWTPCMLGAFTPYTPPPKNATTDEKKD